MQHQGGFCPGGKRGGLCIWNAYHPYEKGNIFNKDPLRVRKLLLHRYEINKIEAKLKEKGLTLVPLKVYFKDSLVKIEIGMARGKSFMISARILPRKIREEKQRETLK